MFLFYKTLGLPDLAGKSSTVKSDLKKFILKSWAKCYR